MTEEELLEKFDTKLGELFKKMRERFIEGRKSHGSNDISKIDYEKEIKEEMMDLLIYTTMRDLIM